MSLPTETDPSDLVTQVKDDYDEEFAQIAAAGLAMGALIFVVRRGWRFFKSIVG